MSSLFTHLFISVVILLLLAETFRLDSRKVLALSFFAVLPDLDAILVPHRALFHNIFILIIPLVFFIFVKSRRDVFGIICFFLAAHLILDLFNGGIFLFYPLYDKVFYASAELRFGMDGFLHVLDMGISDTIMNNGRGEPVISSENVGMAVVLALGLVISMLYGQQKKRL